jgi:hypothetical protein
MRLRQVALVARELEPVVDDLCAILGIEVAFRDPGVKVFGLHNAVMPVGDTFLEVVSPLQPDTTAGRFLDRRGGDGGYMAIVQVPDLAVERERLARLGVRIVWEASLPDIATVHLHPRDVGGAIVSIDWAEPWDSWRWAGPRWQACRRTDRVRAIAGVEVQGRDPGALARRWAEVLGRPAGVASDGSPEIRLDPGCLRFVAERDGRGDGVSAVAFACSDREAVRAAASSRGRLDAEGRLVLCGTRIDLV